MNSEFRLPISPNYVSKWGFWEACREIIQNALDEQEIDTEKELIFRYNKSEERLYIGTTKSRLEPKSLLIGYTTKSDQKRTIGSFGEGYKLALLVLLRLGHEIRIYSQNTIWYPSFVYDKEYESEILRILIVENENDEHNYNGVRFVICDVTPDMNKLLQRNFIKAEENTILKDKKETGRVYVKGLFVCEVEGFENGYNFSPDRLRLDRDRGMVDSFNVKWETSRLLASHATPGELYRAISRKSPEVDYLAHAYMKVEKSKELLSLYEKENGENTVPVTNEEEILHAQKLGLKFKIVPEILKNILKSCKEFFSIKIKTPKELLLEFVEKYENTLTEDQKNELNVIAEKI